MQFQRFLHFFLFLFWKVLNNAVIKCYYANLTVPIVYFDVNTYLCRAVFFLNIGGPRNDGRAGVPYKNAAKQKKGCDLKTSAILSIQVSMNELQLHLG